MVLTSLIRFGVLSSLAPSLVLALCPAPRAAQSVKLDGPLVQPRAGNVSDYLVSADGTRVVYRADQATDEVFELFSAPIAGGAAAVRLNDPLAAGADVSPGARAAGGRIVFTAGQGPVLPLYSVPADGSASPVLLSPGNASVSRFWVVTGGQFVVYLALDRLYRVPTDGSAPPLNLTPGDPVSGYYIGARVWLSADGAMVVFTTSDAFSESLEVVPTDGSAAPLELDTSSPSGFSAVYFDDLLFSADSSRIVYADYEDFDGPIDVDLYSTPVDGSHAPVRLTPQALDGYYLVFEYDGQERVAYRDDALDLQSVRTDGTQRVQLNPPGWLLNPNAFSFGTQLTSDPSNVVFRAESGAQKALFRAPFDGSQATLALVPPTNSLSICQLAILGSHLFASGVLNSVDALIAIPLPGGGLPTILTTLSSCGTSLALTPDGQELVFSGSVSVSNLVELYAVPVDGSEAPRRLSAPSIAAGDVRSFEITPGGERVVYAADLELDETIELHGARLDGTGTPVKYNPRLAGGPVLGDVLAFQAAPDGARVAYLADQDVDEVFDLYSAWSDGHGAPRRLTESLGVAGDVLPDFVFSPTGQRIVFQYDAGLFLLHAVPTNLAQPPVELDVSSNAFPAPLAVTADGARVVYRKIEGGLAALYSARLDGSAPPVVLAFLPGSRTVEEFQLAPPSDSVVYRADRITPGQFELFRVPSDASAAAQKLNAPMIAGGDVDAFRISPDATRVVYRADQDTDAVFELYGVPLDASTPAVKLSGPMVSGGDVREFSLSPDSSRVVYRGDEVVDGRFELFGAPADGSGTAVRLTALPQGRLVQPDFQLSADSRFVLYRANALTSSVIELFVVPIDGSASPVRVSGALVTGGNVTDFALSPDGSRVVYRADANADERFELFGAPADGSSPAVALDPLPAYADVSTFRIDPASSRVVYRADRNADEVLELFAVPMDASAPPERVNRSLPAGADVEADFVPLADGGVLYRADQDANDVLELYHFYDLEPGDRRRSSDTPTRSTSVRH